MTGENLLPVPATRLPAEPEVEAALAAASGALESLRTAVARHPTSSLAWATLADARFDPDAPLESYAYARVGYHRGLDALRKAGWSGQGPIPWAHEPNRGVLRSLYALRRAADAIGEVGEVARLSEFLVGADPGAVAAIAATQTAQSTQTAQIPVQHRAAPPTEAIVIRGED
ncbi:MAG: DUF3151 domain-containing protein [Microbacteriaceae bacterium]